MSLPVQIKNPSIGSDVEFFLLDKEQGEIVSAEPYIKGTKQEPFRFDPNNTYFAVQLDNVLAEGNIPPATTMVDFVRYLTRLRDWIDSNIPKSLTTLACPAFELEEKYLQTETAKMFGCDPSLNCWTGEIIAPKPKSESRLRSAGFHIHVGYESPSEDRNIKLARAMDLFLGVPSVLLEPKNQRKQVGYGLAGNMRHQPHGVEYRTLSSFFASDKKLMAWVYKNTQTAINSINEGYEGEINKLGKIIQGIINTENKAEAKNLINMFEIALPA